MTGIVIGTLILYVVLRFIRTVIFGTKSDGILMVVVALVVRQEGAQQSQQSNGGEGTKR